MTTAKRILHTINTTDAKLLFIRVEPNRNNIEDVYTNNQNLWFYQNSDNVGTKGNAEVEVTNGVFKNPDNFTFSKTQNGFELSEIDFIDAQFKQLDIIDFNNLTLTEKKQFTFYTDYLNEKRKSAEWTLNDYYNHYLQTKRFGFSFYRTYKKDEYNRFLTDLNSHKERFTYILNKLSQHDKNEFINDFLDQLDKLKSHQKLSKFIEYINDSTKIIRTELHAIRIEKAYSIENYKKSYNPFYFKEIINLKNEDNSINPHYYNTLINQWEDYQITEMSKNEYLKEQTRLLKIYNRRLNYLLSHTVRLFKAVDKYNGENLAVVNSFNVEKGEILNLLNRIKWYSSSIKRMKISGEHDLAFRLKEYCHLIFADSINFLRDSLHIDIYKSPLKEEFKEIEKVFETSINIDEVKYFESMVGMHREQNIETCTIKENKIGHQQQETQDDEDDKKNLHTHIFKGNAFKVWQSMFDEFNITERSRTDIKFMFEEMRKKGEGLIHPTVNQTSFLEWIASTYDGLIIQKTSNYSRTNARLQAYSRAKTLYNKKI